MSQALYLEADDPVKEPGGHEQAPYDVDDDVDEW